MNSAPATKPVQARTFDPAPWLADLAQAHEAFRNKYANLDWLQNEREIQLDQLFDDLAVRMRRARSDEDARAVFDRLVAKTADGHVEIDWSHTPEQPSSETGPSDPCHGYDARQNGAGTAVAMRGFEPLGSGDENPFIAGTVNLPAAKIGIVRIGVFQVQGFPQLCRTVVAQQHLPAGRACDEKCGNKISDQIYERMTAALEERARQLRHAGAQILLVDITGNGGGSEWVEAAARIFSQKMLLSERRGMVRGEHWADEWRERASQLKQSEAEATGNDRRQLRHWAMQAEAYMRDAETHCEAGNGCRRIADAAFATGLVGSAPAARFKGKPWGWQVFSPALFPYRDGVWQGPLIVLVDDQTWSAAEEFAAVLQDNRAAVVLGARTGGAGCGHTNGGDPVKLANSGAILLLPDCVRYRADGSNEVRGILPDVVVPIRESDGAHFRPRLVQQYLPQAVKLARRRYEGVAAAYKKGRLSE